MSPPAGGGRSIALVLLLPAVILLVVQQAIPTLRTFAMSFQEISFLADTSQFVGLENYARLPPQFLGTFVLGAAAGLLPALAGYLAGFPIGRLLARSVPLVQRVGLGVLGLGLVTMAPVSFFLARIYQPEARIGEASWLLSSSFLLWVGASLVVGAMLGSATSGVRGGPRVAVVAAGLVGIGAIALGVQMATPTLLAGDELPVRLIYTAGFQQLNFGPAAAASTVILLALIVFGLAATALLLGSRVQLALRSGGPMQGAGGPAQAGGGPAHGRGGPAQGPGAPMQAPGTPVPPVGGPTPPGDLGRPWYGPVGLVLAVVATAAVLATAWPWLRGLGAVDVPVDIAAVLVRTWGMAFVEALLTVGVAALAAIGIGYLRPLEDRSEYLLLLFAPWLFVGAAPLAVLHFLDRQSLGLLDTALAALTPQLLVVPLLFVFTYVAAAVRRNPRQALRPMAAVAGISLAVTMWLQVQSIFWPLIAFSNSDRHPAAVLAYRMAMQTFDGLAGLSLLTPVPLLVLWAVFFVLGVAGLRRFRLLPSDARFHGGPVPPATTFPPPRYENLPPPGNHAGHPDGYWPPPEGHGPPR